MFETLRKKLAGLLRDAAEAHHNAFKATNGVDPDWAIWYAGYLQDPLTKRLGINYTQTELVCCLADAEAEHQARAPDSEWPEYYADQIIERCAPSESPAEDKLALYHSEGCPYCHYVRAAIERLGIDIEMRDVFQNSAYRDELVAARGRATVPVLRITSPDGSERWMPESRDIVRYLEKTNT